MTGEDFPPDWAEILHTPFTGRPAVRRLAAVGGGQAEEAGGDEEEGAGQAQVVGLEDAVVVQHPDGGGAGQDGAGDDARYVRLGPALRLLHPRSTLMLPTLRPRSRV